jgi:hypothetical protein
MTPGEHTALVIDHVRRYAEHGVALVRLVGKRPKDNGWEKTVPGEPGFVAGTWSKWATKYNVGGVLGRCEPPLAVVEPDTPEARAKLLELFGGEWPNVPTVETGGRSLHFYFLANGAAAASRDGLELRAGNQQCVLPPSVHPESRRPYTWREGRELWAAPLVAVFEPVLAYFAEKQPAATAAPVGDEIYEPGRHRALLSLAGTMRRRGLGFDEIAAALRETNRRRCKPPLGDEEVVELVADVVRRYQPVTDPGREQLEREADRLLAAWDTDPNPQSSGESGESEESPPLFAFSSVRKTFTPPDLDPAALHGPAGAYAIATQPYTEASPVAVLACVLVAFGNVIGRTPRVEVGGTVHYGNEFVLLAGPTSIGRKGEAMGIGKRPILLIDDDWSRVSISRGFGSGESIVDAVRDPRAELDDNGNERLVDAGAKDKRLLVNEEEFGHVLAVAGREGSTLSALVRSAWDGHRLENRTKARTLLATNAHVSLLAGITPTELVAKTSELEAANGLLNRFLIVASRRLQLLPSPPAIPLEFDLQWSQAFAGPLRFVREEAAALPTLVRDAAAQTLWETAYTSELSVERFGLAGAVCARAEAHTLRLSMLFALLDESTMIRREHLEAALALWRYCEASARLVFGDRLGDQVADGIMAALRGAPHGELTRLEVNKLFSGHRRKDELDQALALLLSLRLVAITTDTTAGRPVTRIRLVEEPGR